MSVPTTTPEIEIIGDAVPSDELLELLADWLLDLVDEQDTPLPYRGRIYNAEKAATPARPGNANAKKRGGQNVHCVSADDKTSEKLAREN